MAFAIKKYQSDYSIFTNLKPDHLNWHKSLQGYMDAKMNLMKHTTKKSIVNAQVIDFARENDLYIELPKNIRTFSDNISLKNATDGEDIRVSGQRKYKLSETNFSGVHNAMNILACTLVTNEMGICSKRVKQYLTEIR